MSKWRGLRELEELVRVEVLAGPEAHRLPDHLDLLLDLLRGASERRRLLRDPGHPRGVGEALLYAGQLRLRRLRRRLRNLA